MLNLKYLLLVVYVLFISGCSINEPSIEELEVYKQECQDMKKNNKDSFIFAKGECLNYIVSWGDAQKSEINILLHGSWRENSSPVAQRFTEIADDFRDNTNITSIALAMPGYDESTSNRYSNMNWKNTNVIPANESFVKIISQAIKNLKIKYNATKVNIYGKSSGAMLGGIISGYSPGLLDKVILLGGAYNIYFTYEYNGWGRMSPGFISAVNYIDLVDKKTSFLVIAGGKDKKANPIFAKRYVKKLNKAGIKAKVVVFKDLEHSGMESNIYVLEESYKFLKE